jgi:hypothetical protein
VQGPAQSGLTPDPDTSNAQWNTPNKTPTRGATPRIAPIRMTASPAARASAHIKILLIKLGVNLKCRQPVDIRVIL